MHPAFSVIFLTTLIGAGQGLFLALLAQALGARFAVWGALPDPFVARAAALALALLVAGLAASFFHLGRPLRAWRSAAQWRSSWLSREVIALPAAMLLMLAFAIVTLGGFDRELWMLGGSVAVTLATLLGFAALLAVLALYVCTAMIYACLKFLRQWHSPLTVLNFILLGSASGFTLATALAAIAGDPRFDYFVAVAIWLTIAGLLSRWASLVRNRSLGPAAKLQSAIGVHHPKIRQLAQGAMGGSFNTRAFIHQYRAAVVRLARRGFIICAFLLPLGLLLLAEQSLPLICGAAFVLQYLGLLAERWYFFIEAEHPQNIYYQVIS